MKRHALLLAAAIAAAPLSARAADAPAAAASTPKVTYVDHVLPIFKNACLNCHNPDKKKGNLDLSSYTGVMAGGSGPLFVGGDPDASLLYKVMTWSVEPNMPPKGDKLPEKDLAVIRNWIAAGGPETNGSKVVINKPKTNLAVVNSSAGKPTGPIAFPKELPLDPVAVARRPVSASSLAASPWAPLIAVGGHKQIVLFHADSLELLGVIPYPEGVPHALKFSRNGSLLMAGGGVDGKSGKVVLFDVATGNRVTEVGDEFDAVLAADVSPDQARVALGTPLKTAKIYLTADGAAEHTIKKHTDWVQAVAFSPDNKYLATADRAGGMWVWEAATAREVFNCAGHKDGVTDVAFRGDSAVLASGSTDGTIKLWSMEDGKAVKTVANAHAGGVLSLSFTHDGRLVSTGRDGAVKLWGPDGSALKTVDKFNDIALKSTFTHDGQRVVAADFTGQIRVYSTADNKKAGDLTANPPSPAQRLASTDQRLAELAAAIPKADADLAAAQKAADEAAATLKAATDNPAEKIVADAKAKRDKTIAEATAKMTAAKEQATQLQAKVTAVTEARQKNTQALTALTAEVQALRAKLTPKQTALDAAAAALTKAKQAQTAKPADAAAKAKLDEATKAHASATAAHADLKKQLDAKSAAIATEQAKTPKLAEESKATQEALAAAKAIARLTPETHPEIVEAKAAYAKAKLAAEVATKTLPDKQKAAKDAADALATAQSAAKSARDALAAAKSEIPRLKLAVAKSALTQARAQLTAKQSELTQLQEQLKTAKPADQPALKQQIDTLTKAIPALQTTVNTAQAEHDKTAKDVAGAATPKDPKKS
ncbi:MAG TPA: c-type cytochrome domain-containing protein [Tepidisphaeraceae bacterium]|nr:c-type cytochrome domain-containing protein [Tepidisphaeraceae bacterium]